MHTPRHISPSSAAKAAEGVRAELRESLPSTDDLLSPDVVTSILAPVPEDNGAAKAVSVPAAAPTKSNSSPEEEPAPRKRRWLWILFAAVFILGAMGLGAYLGGLSGDKPEPAPVGYISPYDWSRTYFDEKDRLHYTDAQGNPASMVGIDCSEWDTGTDWSLVAADGIQFALIRVGYRGSTLGGLYKDKLFEEAYAGATSNGLLVGLYFFSQATNAQEGREEAEFVLSILDGRHLDLPICFDHEGIADPESRAYGLTHEAYSAAARAFCNRLEHAGYTVAIYGNRYAIAYLGASEMADYSIWLAEWDTDRAHAQFDFSIWQFTNAGHVDGMWRRIDTSIWFLNEVPFKTRASRAAAEEAARGDLPYDLVLVPVDKSL